MSDQVIRDYHAERAQKAADDRTRHAAIAAALTLADGQPWTVEPDRLEGEPSNRLTAADGTRIWIGTTWKGKIEIGGSYGPTPDGKSWIPRDSFRTDETPDDRIGVGIAREPAAIARDICRRLLPGVRVATAKYRETCASMTTRAGALDRIAGELPRLAPHVVSPARTEYRASGYEHRRKLFTIPSGPIGGHGWIEFDETGAGSITASLSPAALRAVLACLEGFALAAPAAADDE